LKTDDNGYGSDVNYAVQSIFGGDVEPARKAIKSWQYQFGSDSYLACYDPADTDCQSALRNKGWDFGSGPSFQVWARTRFPHATREVCSEVSIAFRGTVGLSGGDWFSNADRFGSPYDDYYHQLRRNIDGIISSIKRLPCYRGATQIVSTGHSLGGGLAQLAALANKPTGPRITKVFAFDPSPVTGAHLVEKPLLSANAEGLTIDRIYQEGEVLSYARRLIEEYPSSKSRCRPFVRTVKVDAVSSSNAIGLHGANPLAVQMVELYNDDMPLAYKTPPSPGPKVCGLRYQPPTTDEDGAVVASAGARRILYASARNQRRTADQFGVSDPFGMQPDGSITKLTMSGGSRNKKIRAINSYEMAAQVENAASFTPLTPAQ
jgi:pimeloyl-ACP methyl ester carboxylesterase